MYAVFWTTILAAFLTVTGILHALYLPDIHSGEDMALAANFLQYQKAAHRAARTAAKETDRTEDQAKAVAGSSVPDIRQYLPASYEAAGDWAMTLEITAEGSILYVYGTEGKRRKLVLADVCGLARKQTGMGIKQGNVLVPWNTVLPASIPEGAVVMVTRIR